MNLAWLQHCLSWPCNCGEPVKNSMVLTYRMDVLCSDEWHAQIKQSERESQLTKKLSSILSLSEDAD